MMGPLLFREARADDAPVACGLIYAAGPQGLDYVFGRPLAFLRRAWRAGGGFFGYAVHMVAECSGEVVALGAFYRSGQHGSLGRETARQIEALYPRATAIAMLARSAHLGSRMPRPAPGSAYVANVAVAPSHRRRGIGRALLIAQIDRARADGRRALELDVALDNVHARKLYESLGFEATQVNRFDDGR